MDKRDRDFLIRADRVSQNYRRRITALQAEVNAQSITMGTPQEMVDTLQKLKRLTALQAEYEAHTARVREPREEHRQRQALNRLCRDANRLAGTDGANFFTKAGKVLEGVEL